MTSSALYYGSTTHARKQPSRNRFSYPLYMAFVDVDDLSAGRLDDWPLFSSRTACAVTSLLSRDHMVHEDMARGLGARVRDFVERAVGVRPAGRIMLMTNLRVFGIEFNPVSFYYLMNVDEPTRVDGVVAEVANFPWFEQYPYYTHPQPVRSSSSSSSLPQPPSPKEPHQLIPFTTNDKNFHVSPFMPFEGLRYHWFFSTPSDKARVRISLTDIPSSSPPPSSSVAGAKRERRKDTASERAVFYASLDASRLPWTRRNLLKMQLLYPLHSLFVMYGILYEAAKLFRQGYTFFPHPTGVTSWLSRLVEFFVSIATFFGHLGRPSGSDSESAQSGEKK